MKLADYLKAEGISNTEFAKRTGLSEGTVSLLCRDETWPSEKTSQIVYRETDGKVTPNDFFKPQAAE